MTEPSVILLPPEAGLALCQPARPRCARMTRPQRSHATALMSECAAAASCTPRPRRTLALEIFKPARHALSFRTRPLHPVFGERCGLSLLPPLLSCAPRGPPSSKVHGVREWTRLARNPVPMLRNVDSACANPPVSVSAAVHSISYDVMTCPPPAMPGVDLGAWRRPSGCPRGCPVAARLPPLGASRDEAEPPFGGSI